MSFSSFFDYDADQATPAVATEPRTDDLVFLSRAGDAEWDKLLAHTQLCPFTAGDVVLHEGDAERTLYIVGDGELEALPSRDGAWHAATIGPGMVAGDLSFFDGRPQPVTVRAATGCELLRLNLDAFEVLAAREPALGRMVLLDLGRILALRLRRGAIAGAV